jgi:hypothetical protein
MNMATHFGTLRDAIAQANSASSQYKEDLFGIVTYAGRVRAYSLPVLAHPDQWPGGADVYEQTQTAWSTTTGTLQGWAQSTLTNLTALPITLLNDGTQVMSPTLTMAISAAQQLQSNPGDGAARANLGFALSTLASNFSMLSGMTGPLITSLEGQATVFDQNAAQMTAIAANALTAAGNDQAQITDLNAKISQLQDDIKSRALLIAGGSFVSVLGIGMGILAIALAPFTAGVSLFLLVPAILITAGGALIIGLNAAAIVQDKEAISAAGSSISTFNADIALVNTMSTNLSGFASQVDSLKTSLSVVVAPWQAAETYFTQTMSTVGSIQQSSDWGAITQELQHIQSDWNALMTTVDGMRLNATVATNANLTMTMTDQQITQALSGATTVPMAQYLVAA